MSNNERFTIASIRERVLLKRFLKHQNDFTAEVTSYTGTEKYDAIITSGGTRYIIEIKVRTQTSTSYPNWIIEKPKYDFLTSYGKEHNLVPLYLNFYPDSLQIWNLNTTAEPAWFNSLLPPDSQYSQGLINKTNGILSSIDASIYHYNFDIFEAADKAKELYKIHFK